MFGWRLVRIERDHALMSDDDLIAVLHRHGRKVWNIWVGITPASERTREAAGNIGLCIEGCIRELKGWL